jgi:GGDEF domain-containing protein
MYNAEITHMSLLNFLSNIPTDAVSTLENILIAAQTDALTGLLNQNAWIERRRKPAMIGSIMIALDVKGLKAANKALGQNGGDQLLAEAAAELRSVFKRSDDIYRSGGDEFVVIVAPEDLFRLSMLSLDRWHIGYAVVGDCLETAVGAALEKLRIAKEQSFENGN